MKRFVLALAAVAVIGVAGAPTAAAGHPGAYPFFPFGFYQPYGANYANTTPTPPYFALNPPVYYGARYARPYGMSPFAAPPMVETPAGYRGRLRTDFYLPPMATPQPPAPPSCNPCVSHSASKPTVKVGQVQTNPFVTENQLVKR